MATVVASTSGDITITLGDEVLSVSADDVIDAIKRQQSLCRLVSDMRHAQKEYFRTRSASALEKSKSLEARVDRECEKSLGGQSRLFG